MSGKNKYLTLKEIQHEEVRILKEVIKYLNKNNIKYYIYAGSYLGAIRHKGFIPWDDDIDIAITRLNYDKLLQILSKNNKINNSIEAIPVIRHGENVEYTKEDLITLINKLKDNYNTIAIITKDNINADKLYKKFKGVIDINLISSDNLNYYRKINILPSYLSKGLEFDSVIIIDTFNKDSVMDLKLLYVSMTRALHKLYKANYEIIMHINSIKCDMMNK